MQQLRRAALVLAALCLPAASVRADLIDGNPCFTYINPPGNGVRYVCTSTSSHTVEHPGSVSITSNAWRTRITARREGSEPIYDVTTDSLTPPDLSAAIAEAGMFVTGNGYVLDTAPMQTSSTTSVISMPVAVASAETIQVIPVSVPSSATARMVCVGSLGDLSEPPPPLPEAPCPAGATAVPLRPLDPSPVTPLEDGVEDTHRHVQTDHYNGIFVTGDLTTTHVEIVARPTPPCVLTTGRFGFATVQMFSCLTTSHHTISHASTASITADAWSTRVTARLRGGSDLFDVTINATTAPEGDSEVRQALGDARQAVAQVAGPGADVNGPVLVASSAAPATGAFLAGGATVTQIGSTFNLPVLTTFCAGDLGDLPAPAVALPVPPCRPGLWTIQTPDIIPQLVTNHDTHSQRDVYAGLHVTGTLTTTHYEFVAEPATPTLTIPIVLSPSGGSAFSSELTLANLAPTDVQVTFAYTPAFGGTTGTVTDTLPGETQRIIPDALAYLKGLGLNDPGAGGVLRVTVEGSAAPDVYASVRTTAAVPEGRVGLAYPALPPSKLFSSASVFLSGLRQNALDRSNVAVLNAGGPADGDVTLRLTANSGDPANPMTKALPDVTLSPGGFSQISSILISNGLSLGNGYVRVERVAGSAPFYTYAVVNDQATADGSFIEPVPASPVSPIASTTMPVLVETFAYSTELVLTNTSSTNRTLNFTWVAPALTGGMTTFSISLLPNEQQILPAFVQLLRDRGAIADARGPSFTGALFVSDSSGDLRGVSISARILSSLGGGRAGVALPSYPSGNESTAPVWLCGLQQSAETRSNVALVNVGSVDASPSDFRIDLYDGATGAKVASPVATVPARGFVQIDRILSTYAPGMVQGCALVTRVSGSNPFLAYAVLNDGAQPGQRSGDGAFVASVPLLP